MIDNNEGKVIIDMERSMWINASAGSGKTTLLIKRLIALLINKRKNIICITFTRAAAAEMQNRLNNILSKLPLMQDSEITNFCQEYLEYSSLKSYKRNYSHKDDYKECYKSGHTKLNQEGSFNGPDFNYIRDLFYNADELVKISTIHSFCLSSLQELNPDLNALLLEESGDINLFTDLIDEFLNEEYIFANNLSELLTENSLKEIFQQFLLRYNIDNIDKLNIRRLSNNNNNNINSNSNNNVSNVSSSIRNIKNSDNGSFVTSKSSNIAQENERIIEQLNKFNLNYSAAFNQDVGYRTILLLGYFNKLVAEYRRRRPNKITYNALIDSIIALINTDSGLLYQLSQKIDHILLDEAQDTNLKQWFLIAKLLEEFFIHEKAKGVQAKTIFIVGDSKQSIYSFQGASPLIFEGFYSLIKAQDIRNDQLLKIEINTSYRASAPILELVDHIFNCNNLQITEAGPLKHNIFRKEDLGYTEIWPFIKNFKKAEEREVEGEPRLLAAQQIAAKIKEWIINKRLLPAKSRLVRASDCAILVAHRSSFISHLQLELQKHNIPINFIGKIKIADSEILSLLLIIGKFIIAPYDELNLIKLLKAPIFNITDGEIFNIKTKDLETNLWSHIENIENIEKKEKAKNIEKYIKEATNFHAILEKPKSEENKELSNNRIFYAAKILAQWLRVFGSPFNIYTKIITKEVSKRLELYYGTQCAFYLEIFLDNAFKYASMPSFIERISAEDAQLEINSGNNEGVTISTVHGAKGQQFPIVFLSDSNYIPQQKDILLYNEDNLPFWYKNENIEYFEKIKASRKKEIYEEYLRLLYVGLTRAEEEIYILAWGNNIRKNSWYELCLNAFEEIGRPADIEGSYFYTNYNSDNNYHNYYNYHNYKDDCHNSFNSFTSPKLADSILAKVSLELRAESAFQNIKNSKNADDYNLNNKLKEKEESPGPLKEAISSIILSDVIHYDIKNYQGILAHKILQYIFAVEAYDRVEWLENFLANFGLELTLKESENIKSKILEFLNPQEAEDLELIAQLESQKTRTELELLYCPNPSPDYKRQQLKSELLRLDSLIINEIENSILIIDYKTKQERNINNNINNKIEEQLEKYKQAIETIYPNKIVKTKIFWL